MAFIPFITGCSETGKPAPLHVRWRVLNATAPAIAVKETYAVIHRTEGWFTEPSERLDNWGDGEFAVVVHAMANALASKSAIDAITILFDI